MNETRYRQAERGLWERAGARPSERRVRLWRLDVEVRVQEVGAGPPTLFLHGGPNAGSTWAPLVGRLGSLRCLVVDRPGTGLSDPLPDGPDVDSVPGFGDAFVADLLDALDVERAHLVGSSFGGYLALRAAPAHPERIERIVQFGCPAFVPGMRLPAFMRLMLVPGMRHVMGVLPPTERATRMTLRQIGHGTGLDAGRIWQEFIDWYVSLQRDTDTFHHETAMIAGLGSVRGFAPSLALNPELLAAVVAPTLLVWGDDDAFGGAEVAQQVAALLPDAELELVAGAGHLPWLDEPALAAKATQRHLTG